MFLNLEKQFTGARTVGTAIWRGFGVWCQESNRICEPRALNSAAKDSRGALVGI